MVLCCFYRAHGCSKGAIIGNPAPIRSKLNEHTPNMLSFYTLVHHSNFGPLPKVKWVQRPALLLPLLAAMDADLATICRSRNGPRKGPLRSQRENPTQPTSMNHTADSLGTFLICRKSRIQGTTTKKTLVRLNSLCGLWVAIVECIKTGYSTENHKSTKGNPKTRRTARESKANQSN